MNSKLKIQKNHGFVALMSVIIISVILLLVATTLSRTGFSGRLNILDSEYKERSSALAEACVDTALLRLATDTFGPPDVDVGTDKCTIISADHTTIKTKAEFNKAYTNLIVVIDSDYKIVSWEEVP